MYTTDRLSWRDLAGLAQGLLIYSDKPVMWPDLANLAPEKKNSSAPPGQITLYSAVFPLLIEIFVGWDALAKAKEGQRENLKEKENPTGQAPGVITPSRLSRTLCACSYV